MKKQWFRTRNRFCTECANCATNSCKSCCKFSLATCWACHTNFRNLQKNAFFWHSFFTFSFFENAWTSPKWYFCNFLRFKKRVVFFEKKISACVENAEKISARVVNLGVFFMQIVCASHGKVTCWCRLLWSRDLNMGKTRVCLHSNLINFS